MESLRSSRIAAERLVSQLATSVRGEDRGNAFSASKVGLAIVLTVLSVTNLLTYRALEKERVRRVAAERSLARPERSTSIVFGPSSEIVLRGNRSAVQVPHAPLSVNAVAQQAVVTTPAVSFDSARLAKKLSSPEARDALRLQMKGPTLQLYGELLRRWHLSGPAADSALDALADYQSHFLIDALNPGGRAAIVVRVADNDAVRAALTAKQLDDLRDYDESSQDRQSVAPLLSELELAQTPLSKDTAEQLIGMMHDERVAVPPPIAQPGAQAPTVQAMDQWQSDLDQRIRDRAEFILPSAAYQKLEAFQNAQRTAASVFSSALPENAATTGAGAPNMSSSSN